MTAARYAIYYAPAPESDLWRLGSGWLGRDAATGCMLVRAIDSGPAILALDTITEIPARYGFHATLKAPFRMVEGETPEKLLDFAVDFAGRHAPVILPGLRVATIDDFVALVPTGNQQAIGDLAAACVREFDRFRAPLTADEFARRKQDNPSPRQAALLERWGYPFVLDEFRFHMTLTGPLANADLSVAQRALANRFADVISGPLEVDSIAVFEQADAEHAFRIRKRIPLTGR